MAFINCNNGSPGGTVDFYTAFKGYKQVLHIRADSNSGDYAGPLFDISTIKDDMTFTITGGTSTMKISAIFAYLVNNTDPNTWSIGSRVTIASYNQNTHSYSFSAATLLGKWTAAQLSSNTHIALSVGNYSGANTYIFEIS